MWHQKGNETISFVFNLNFFIMAHYISSVAVVLSLKTARDVGSMKSFVITLDVVSGSTLSHAVNFVCKHPLIKRLLSDYRIVNLTFNYSEL